MTEVDSALMPETLKRLQADVGDMKADMSDVRLRLTANEERLTTLVMSVSGINHRPDRPGDRVERIERRLDLMDHV